ncbi:HAD family hydrolase [Paenibacillus pseudetheri]|uniref:HAD family hydrolase n=1 Tax=Paenibacillus pseudetheri TaxID=2897682 RepID=A0ABN8FSU5_9BACL|nr:HAD family hydrolase [Paenibacillus pseudetheri]CAH1058970.1 hypothetical protein PAECIP111894_05156 [Paenibacillus pseudetheri]
MNNFKVISLDMFQTLVNLDNRTLKMWEEILGDPYNVATAQKYQSMLLAHYFDIVSRIRTEQTFVLTKEIYKECFERVFAELNMTYDSSAAVSILVHEHTKAEFYKETLDFIEYITAKYEVCIVSDTDEDMLPPFYGEYRIRLFASESYKSYKNDHNNMMFQEIIKMYGVEPGQIIHIGDTPSDILGAQRAGIQACWINRKQQSWNQEQAPDYTVYTLDEITNIL